MLLVETEASFSAFIVSYTGTYFSPQPSIHVQDLDDLQTRLVSLLQIIYKVLTIFKSKLLYCF